MKHTILLLEDELELRELVQEALELNGYEVVAVGDGQAALEAMDGIEHICMVLLDLLMPRMNGWAFFQKLRERPELADVPVVVHSSSPTHAPAGVTRVLHKPMQLERLISVVQEYCAQ
jgi:two-component system, chemotaxis family, chemotaxis protein CheY